MIDVKDLSENPDKFRASQRARGADESVVDAIIAADSARRAALIRYENLRAEQNVFGKKVAQAKGDEKKALLAEVKELANTVKAASAEADAAQAKQDELLRSIPNLIEDGVPEGGEDDYVVVKTVGTPREFPDFEPKDHLEIGELIGAIDMERGAKVSGSRFYFLRGVGARLEMALLQMAMDQAIEAGFVPMITPTLVRPETMQGTGFDVKHDAEIYRLAEDDLYLVGTSEVALAGYHADEILDLAGGPIRFAGQSSCYRREAGSHGKDTRGIIRVHQFNKVEMFIYTTVEEAAAEHERLLAWEEEMLAKCELPYRVIDTAAGDLGMSAARKFDCEAWVPTQGAYRELTSTSNCTTFQARRLNIRERVFNEEGVAEGNPRRGHAERHAGHHPLDRGHAGAPPERRRLGQRPGRAAEVPRRPDGSPGPLSYARSTGNPRRVVNSPVYATGISPLGGDFCLLSPARFEFPPQYFRVRNGFPVPADHRVADRPEPVLAFFLRQDGFPSAAVAQEFVVEILGVAVELPDDAVFGPEEVGPRNESFVVIKRTLEDRSGKPQNVDECPAPGLPDGFRRLVSQCQDFQDPTAFGGRCEAGRRLLKVDPGQARAFLAAASKDGVSHSHSLREFQPDNGIDHRLNERRHSVAAGLDDIGFPVMPEGSIAPDRFQTGEACLRILGCLGC